MGSAEKEYKIVLQQNPQLPGTHFLLGRFRLSKPDAGPTAAQDAKKEFEAELGIDPTNAGAEYVLGEIPRQENQWPDAIRRLFVPPSWMPALGRHLLGLGTALLSAKRFSEAIPPLRPPSSCTAQPRRTL